MTFQRARRNRSPYTEIQITAKIGPDIRLTIDEDEEDTLFEAGEFGDSSPVALQRTV